MEARGRMLRFTPRMSPKRLISLEVKFLEANWTTGATLIGSQSSEINVHHKVCWLLQVRGSGWER